MKAILLSAFLMVAAVSGVRAQYEPWKSFPPDPKWEVGASYGASIITNPKGPLNDYQGTTNKIVKDISIKATYMLNPRWNVSFDLGFRKWETYGVWQQPYLMGQSLKPTNVKFVFGNPAISHSLQVNYCFPHYNKHEMVNNANIYVGATLGLVTTVNDGSTDYAPYNAAPDSNYRVVATYNYPKGIGYNIGIHGGYTRYIYKRIGVNIEASARYVRMGTDKPNGSSYVDGNSKYHMMFFPVNFGIKYRFTK
jgi:hypothetical protein